MTLTPRQKIIVILLCLLAMPIILAISLNSYYGIVDYANFKTADFKKLIDFTKLVIENLFERKMKSEIYYSVAYACAPLILIISMVTDIISKQDKNTHGKARFANKNDIESYVFHPIQFTKDCLRLFNPYNYFVFLIFFGSKTRKKWWNYFKTTFKNIFKLGLEKTYPANI